MTSLLQRSLKKRIKYLLLSLAALLAGMIIYKWDMLVYLAKQGSQQAKVLMNAEPYEDFIEKNKSEKEIIEKLSLMPDILAYAKDSLHLAPGKNYTKIFNQNGKPITYIVIACKPYSFDLKTWEFPIAGEVPYIGFFDLKDAKQLQKELNNEDYDTYISEVTAFSTLGWFNDPLLSEMLKKPVGDMAEVIFHELTHKHIYVKDSAELNENLASFIGEQAATSWLKDYYGENSKEANAYTNSLERTEKYIDLMLICRNKLDSLYTEMKDMSNQNKKSIKNEFLKNLNGYIKIELGEGLADKKLNNAYFSHFKRYHSYKSTFTKTLDEVYNNNISSFISAKKIQHAN